MDNGEKIGVLLVNTGSPDAAETRETRAFLRRFLSDPRVMDMNPVGRWCLLNFVILPFRPRRSAEAYRQIWTDEGSPLLMHSRACRDGLQDALSEAEVAVGMAYGTPSVTEAMDQLIDRRVSRIVVVPMFPQYASATCGSILEAVYTAAAGKTNVPALSVVPPFFDDDAFLDACAEVARGELDGFGPDHVLLSFHGLPERHVFKSDPTGGHCLKKDDCCDGYRDANPNCYRAHCFATAKGIVKRLALREGEFSISFQSKLGGGVWLAPATGERVRQLASGGVKRLAVLTPAFVADCLETLEEIGIRAKNGFLDAGGSAFHLVPSLNSHPAWIGVLAGLVRDV